MHFAPRGRRRPHVVLVHVDQWRADCLSAAGHPVVATPFLDSLAGNGVRFDRAYAPSPTCVPSRTSMLTGLVPSRTRRVGYVDGVRLDVAPTLADAFRAGGYQTKAIGKMHVAPDRNRAGFDDVTLHNGYCHDSRLRSTTVDFTDDYVPWLRRRTGDPTADVIDLGQDPNAVPARPWEGPEALHPANFVVTQAVEWLYRRDPDAPFLLYLSFAGPHAPYTPPAWAFDRYLDSPAADGYRPADGNWRHLWQDRRADHEPDAHVAEYDAETARRARAGYFGNMTHIDAQLARLYAALREFGLAYDTYLVFTSDHGEMLGDHGMWRKGYPYEASAGVPLLVAGPGVDGGRVRHDLVTLEDLMPTLLDLADVPVPGGLDGRSHAARILGEPDTTPVHRVVHGEHVIFGLSLQWLRTPRWTYVWRSSDGVEQLFDATGDGERTDLARDPAPGHAEVLAALRAALVARLRGRPEGFVSGDRLVPGRPVSPLLDRPFVPEPLATALPG